ncbi:hypothetical protein NKG99_03895 [Mesorhizobium sp. M1409]|uniref:hypothetical protein n=1 Tax=Mesorhizobium sp. M1409 TaxID=2957100 RepID=UPI00333D8E8F
MPSLKDFMEALAVAWPVALTALIGSAVVLTANSQGLSYATGIPAWTLTALFVVAAFAAGSCLVSLLQAVGGLATWCARWNRTRIHRKTQVEWLNNLPANEHRLMSFLFTSNMQAFPYPFAEGRFVSLITKGLVLEQSGQHAAISWPHVIPDHIWAEMKKDPAKFRPDQGDGNPMRRF